MSKIRVPAGLSLLRVLFLVADCQLLVFLSGREQREEASSLILFYKGINPIHEGFTLITLSNSNYLPKAPVHNIIYITSP